MQIAPTLRLEKIRAEFPILKELVNGKPLVYFDNAATNQKPKQVIDALSNYYSSANANIHRGIHTLAERATAEFEATRNSVREFLNAAEREEIIFTSGTTDSINLVAQSYGRKFLNKGDEVLISAMEHHSNIVPWQIICEEKECRLRVIPVNDNGELIMDEFENLLNPKTKIVSVVYASNAMGTINPVREITRKAHEIGAVVMVDGAQAAAHLMIDVQDIDCDFFAFSFHKAYGPTGVGVLYGKRDLLGTMPPYRGGGEMIKEVTFEKTTYNELPYKFEAGTPNIADVVAAKAAIDFINSLGKENIAAHEDELLKYATEALQTVEGLSILGNSSEKVSVISFLIKGLHHQDIGVLLDQQGIAVRTGHHCVQPLMTRFGITGTTRASFSVYNTTKEIDRLLEGLQKARKMLG